MATPKQPQSQQAPQTPTSTQTEFSVYARTLSYNVITRYDPNIKQLLYHTPYCQLYQYSSITTEWSKLEHSGVMALYSRDTTSPGHQPNKDDIYTHGIIILNKSGTENFTLGLLSNEDSQRYGISEVKVEYQTDYIIVKSLVGDVYGLWIHEEKDRIEVKALIDGILQNRV